jgi:N4-gp56 family major capsid protein
MAIDHFIPEVWASSVLMPLNNALVFGNLVNREYQKDIVAFGDTVHINSFAKPTIGDYTKNGSAGAPQTLTSSQQSLLIDAAKYFNFEIDDIDKAQQNPKIMTNAMQEAAYGLADEADLSIAGLHTGVAAANIVGMGNDTTAIVPTSTTIYSYFTKAGRLLNEANVPKMGRWVVIPPWMYELLQNSGEFTSASSLGDSVVVTGKIGSVAGFDVYVSNNVDNTAGAFYKVMFGYPGAITFADQVNSVEAFRPEASFSDAVKGLYVYGTKLVRDTGIVVFTASES